MPGEFQTITDLQAILMRGYKPAKIYEYKRDGDICVWFSKEKSKKRGDSNED